jgi:hypothetical protein
LPHRTQETAVLCDFSENCSVIQDEVQDLHWNNAQAALHPFVAYSQNIMAEHINCANITDCLRHNIVAVHLFQRQLCSSLSGKLKDLTKTIFLMVLPCSIKTGNTSSTSAII